MVIEAKRVAKASNCSWLDIFPFSNKDVPLLTGIPPSHRRLVRRVYSAIEMDVQTVDAQKARAGPLLMSKSIVALKDMPERMHRTFHRLGDLSSPECAKNLQKQIQPAVRLAAPRGVR